MYIPKAFEERDLATMHDLMRQRPFATWVTTVETRLTVNHLPFVLDGAYGERSTLAGHVARSNPIWRSEPPDHPS